MNGFNTNVEKEFKVVSVSSNTNSFGLYGVIMIARDGEAMEIAVGNLYKPKIGDILIKDIILAGNGKLISYTFRGISYELPRNLPEAPKEVVREVWETSKL